MTTLSRLLNENENATIADIAKHMSSVEEFHERVRKCDTSANSKEWLTETMQEITGDTPEGGAIVKRLVNPLNSKMYLEFFPLFKLVSRMCYLGAAIRKIKLQIRKVAASEKSVAEKVARLAQIQALINSMSFKNDLVAERERLEKVELEYAVRRLQMINDKLAVCLQQQRNFA